MDSIQVLNKKQAKSRDESKKTFNFHWPKMDIHDYFVECVYVISILLITIILLKIVLRAILPAGTDL